MIALKKHIHILNIHPLLPITLALMLGIYFQSLGLSFYWLFGLFYVSCFISYFYKNILYTFFVSFLLIGALLYQKNIHFMQAFQSSLARSQALLLLQITDINPSNHRFLKCKVTGNLITNKQNTLLGKQSLLWYLPHFPKIKVGDIVSLKNCNFSIPKQNSIQQYFLRQNIAGTIHSKEYELSYRPTINIQRWLFEWREQLIQKIKNRLSQKTYSFIMLLFFGNKDIDKKNMDTLKNDFKHWGISHYLARSGLHLIIFIFLWETLLKLVPLAYFFKQFLLCLLTLIYSFFSWPSLSFGRSLATFFLYKYGLFYEKQIHPIHAITLITLSSLFINPFYLFFLDFQLSFGITFLLAWANHIPIKQTSPSLQNS